LAIELFSGNTVEERMESITTAKYIIGKYYPRSHLLAASALSLLLISILFLGPEQPAHEH